MTIGRRLAAMVLAAAAWAAHGAVDAAAITVVDDRGAQVSFDRSPRRIVSLLPSITESVCSLGACDRLVGTDRYSNWPDAVRALPKLGGLDDAQIERIAALRPDVVLAAKSARVAERLEALGLKVVLLDSETYEQVRRSLATIAQLLGTPSEADRVWNGIERDVSAAAARVPPGVRGERVYFEVAPVPFAAGSASFLGETLSRIGMRNIVPPELGPFPRLNPEFVVRSAPDIIMASQRELATMAGRPGWSGLVALRRRQVCGFETARYEVLVRPGPRLGEAALMLADCLAALLPRTRP